MSDRTCSRFRMRAASVAGALLLAASMLGGCAWPVVDRGHVPAFSQSKEDVWAVLPLRNNTETPQAGQRAASIAHSVLAAQGFTNIVRYPASSDDETLFDPAKPDRRRRSTGRVSSTRATRSPAPSTNGATRWAWTANRRSG